MKQEYGGLGILNMRELNLCLLGSWIRRYTLDEKKLWKQLVDSKCNTNNPTIFTCNESCASNFWKCVIWAANVVKLGYRWRVKKGNKVRFWEDLWVGNASLTIQYWEIYCIVNEQNKSITDLQWE
jgi:hypothetical protein